MEKEELISPHPDQMITVSHRGTTIPIRFRELPVWAQMSWAQREKMIKAYRSKVASGDCVKLENGALLKKENAV